MNTMTCTWTGGLRFVHTANSGHAVVTDAPRESGGEGSAASPMELVLLGLIGCTGVDVVSILQKMQQPVRDFAVRADYERSEDHPRVYTKIHLTYTVTGDVSESKLQRAIKLSEETFCSVSAMLRPTVAITHSYEILPAG